MTLGKRTLSINFKITNTMSALTFSVTFRVLLTSMGEEFKYMNRKSLNIPDPPLMTQSIDLIETTVDRASQVLELCSQSEHYQLLAFCASSSLRDILCKSAHQLKKTRTLILSTVADESLVKRLNESFDPQFRRVMQQLNMVSNEEIEVLELQKSAASSDSAKVVSILCNRDIVTNLTDLKKQLHALKETTHTKSKESVFRQILKPNKPLLNQLNELQPVKPLPKVAPRSIIRKQSSISPTPEGPPQKTLRDDGKSSAWKQRAGLLLCLLLVLILVGGVIGIVLALGLPSNEATSKDPNGNQDSKKDNTEDTGKDIATNPTIVDPVGKEDDIYYKKGDKCNDAIVVNGYFNVEADNVNHLEDTIPCFDDSVAHAGKWFKVKAKGESMTITTCFGSGGVKADVAVMEGDGCNSLQCVAMTNRNDKHCRALTWPSKVGKEYFLLVFGNTTADAGAFNLQYLEEPPAGSRACENAIAMEDHDFSIVSTNEGTVEETPSCDMISSGLYSTFFTVIGTGERLIANTDFAETTIDTAVAIYTGDCWSFQCVHYGHDLSTTNRRTKVVWYSELGTKYYIHVFGANPYDHGVFRLDVDVDNMPLNSDCADATAIDRRGGEATGTNFGATSEWGACIVPNMVYNTVWFRTVGTGFKMYATTCFPDTEFDTGIAIVQLGCGMRQCVAYHHSRPDGCAKVEWYSEPGVPYRIQLYGFQPEDWGNYHIRVDSYL